jgi:hypothetical protein
MSTMLPTEKRASTQDTSFSAQSHDMMSQVSEKSRLRTLHPPTEASNSKPRRPKSSPSTKPNETYETYETFLSLLQPPLTHQSRQPTQKDIHDDIKSISEAAKKIRRLVLTAGIPEVVSYCDLRCFAGWHANICAV